MCVCVGGGGTLKGVDEGVLWYANGVCPVLVDQAGSTCRALRSVRL